MSRRCSPACTARASVAEPPAPVVTGLDEATARASASEFFAEFAEARVRPDIGALPAGEALALLLEDDG